MIRLTDFPDDILEDIFHGMRDIIRFPGEPPYSALFQQDDDGGESYSANRTRKAVPLWANVIILSHVCRHWRNLMLSLPRIWTSIRVTGTFANRVMVNEMIERSHCLPLSILLTNHRQFQDGGCDIFDLLGVTSVIADHCERIQELGVVLHPSHAVLIVDFLSKYRVPILEKLWLDSGGNAVGVNCGPPISMFSTMVPPLRFIHTHDVSIPWLPFCDLVTLELTCGTSPPLPALLDTLQHCPLLQVLTLRIPFTGAKEHDTIPDGEPAAVLPCLRRLQLQVDPVFGAAFAVLPYIEFPPSTAVRLSFTSRFASSLYENCESLQALACNVEHANLTVDDRTYLVSQNPPLSIDYQLGDREIEDELGALGHMPLLARLCEGFFAVPLPALRSLSIYIYKYPNNALGIDDKRLTSLFQAVPTIRRLVVEVHSVDSAIVFTALGRTVKDGQGNEAVLCPELQELAVMWQDNWPSVDDFWNLERCCHARAFAGRGLARLETAAFPLIVRASLEKSVPWIVEVVDT